MTTTDNKTEYVTDVEHSVGCRSIDGRSALYLMRHIAQTQAAYFDEPDGVSLICGPDDRNWDFEETLEPMKLCCSFCGAERDVAQDEHGDIVALTPERCLRYSRVYGHFANFDRKPCEYCGYVRSGGA